MKKLLNVLTLALALNFIALSGGAGWMWQQKKLTKESAMQIKEILFPPATQPTTQPAVATTQPDDEGSPLAALEELLQRRSGLPAAEQLEFIQETFDAKMAQLDQRQRELANLEVLVGSAKEKVAADRAALEAERAALESEKQETARLAADTGFQNSLNLYLKMPGKQVKDIFMNLDDATVTRYLEAMQPGTAARIVKEFKSPGELERIKGVLERMRQPPVTEANAADVASSTQ